MRSSQRLLYGLSAEAPGTDMAASTPTTKVDRFKQGFNEALTNHPVALCLGVAGVAGLVYWLIKK